MQVTRRLLLAVAAVGVAATVAVVGVAPLRFAYRSPDLHLTLVTTEALIAMLAAYLVVGRFRRSRRWDDLVLASGLAVLSLVNLLFAALPAVFASDTSVFSTWASLLGRLAGAALLALASRAAARPIRRGSSRPAQMAAGVVLLLAVVAGIVAALDGHLPSALAADASPERSGVPRLEGPASIVVMHAAALVLYLVAAAGFGRKAQDRDPLLSALAVGTVIAAVARLNYMLFPSAGTPYVYTGDLFRLLFYLLLLVGALAEVGTYWRSVAEAATLDERRRIARDLHDGIAQELASIRRHLYYLDENDRSVLRARAATERALAAARRAVATLADSDEQPLPAALGDMARHVAEREGVQVVLSLAPGVKLAAAEREALLMIASEAITNAARHGHARTVRVDLVSDPRVRLTIRDDGTGFDPATIGTGQGDGGGYGLLGMRARAEQIGARLQVRTERDAGTVVEAQL